MEGRLWLEARDALAGVAEFCHQRGGEGLDIYCLNSPRYRLDMRVGYVALSPQTPTSLVDRMNRTSAISSTVLPHKVILFSLLALVVHITSGQTPLGAKLRQILDTYVPKIEEPSSNHKPINILVITDGVPSE